MIKKFRLNFMIGKQCLNSRYLRKHRKLHPIMITCYHLSQYFPVCKHSTFYVITYNMQLFLKRCHAIIEIMYSTQCSLNIHKTLIIYLFLFFFFVCVYVTFLFARYILYSHRKFFLKVNRTCYYNL